MDDSVDLSVPVDAADPLARIDRLEADLRTRRDDLRELAVDRERLHFALAGSGLGMWDWNCQTNEIRIDDQWARMLGYELAELDMSLSTWESLIHPEDLGKVYADLKAHLDGDTEYYENTHRLRTKTGEYRWILDRGKVFAWTDDGEPLRACGTHRDIHQEKLVEARLQDLALRDPLTELANRRYLESLFGHSVAQAERAGSELGLVYLDLDGFKPVNDTHGHDAGDAALKAIGERLTAAIRGQDVVARIGGDEFCVLVTQARDAEELVGLSRRIIRIISEPVTAGGVEVRLGCSVGVARYPVNGLTLDELMKAADTAMYSVKASGKGDVALAA